MKEKKEVLLATKTTNVLLRDAAHGVSKAFFALNFRKVSWYKRESNFIQTQKTKYSSPCTDFSETHKFRSTEDLHLQVYSKQ
jgi:hypothetical protein